jgi:hypothetical protein
MNKTPIAITIVSWLMGIGAALLVVFALAAPVIGPFHGLEQDGANRLSIVLAVVLMAGCLGLLVAWGLSTMQRWAAIWYLVCFALQILYINIHGVSQPNPDVVNEWYLMGYNTGKLLGCLVQIITVVLIFIYLGEMKGGGGKIVGGMVGAALVGTPALYFCFSLGISAVPGLVKTHTAESSDKVAVHEEQRHRSRHRWSDDDDQNHIDPEVLRKSEALALKTRWTADVEKYATVKMAADVEKYDPQSTETSFVKMQVQPPAEHPSLTCYFLAPKEWQSVDLGSTGRDFKNVPDQPFELAELRGAEPHVTLETWLAHQSKPLSEFFDEYIHSVGFTVSEKKEAINRIDAVVKYDSASVKGMMARMTFVKVGNNIFWLCGCAPENNYSNCANAFSISSATFCPVGYAPALSPPVASKSVPWKLVTDDNE